MSTTIRHTRPAVALAMALGCALAACRESTVSDPNGTATNTPAVGITPQALGFSVLARGFSFEETYASPTQGDSLAVGLAVTGYAGGSALIEIFDSTGTRQFQQAVAQSIAQGQTTVRGSPPYRVHVLFVGFTGMLALGVQAQGL
jgi:hypothetical protein